jgi:hypothetical protein
MLPWFYLSDGISLFLITIEALFKGRRILAWRVGEGDDSVP